MWRGTKVPLKKKANDPSASTSKRRLTPRCPNMSLRRAGLHPTRTWSHGNTRSRNGVGCRTLGIQKNAQQGRRVRASGETTEDRRQTPQRCFLESLTLNCPSRQLSSNESDDGAPRSIQRPRGTVMPQIPGIQHKNERSAQGSYLGSQPWCWKKLMKYLKGLSP